VEKLEKIPFNVPFQVGKEGSYIQQAMKLGVLSGNGNFTKKAQGILEKCYAFEKVLLTTSCTDALEMAAILMEIEPGDEVILPSYTFVSTANAFVLRGAKIRYVDSRPDHPGMDESAISALINENTKVIVPVHYAGVACDMDMIKAQIDGLKIRIVEDAAQAIDSKYKDEYLGSIGEVGCFSFHETKNISSGEGGALLVNEANLRARAEILWEKGTNRAAFWRGEIDKYSWVDVGSSYLPSELNAAYLTAQLEDLRNIQNARLNLWNKYHEAFAALETKGVIRRPIIPEYASNNAHMYYLILNSLQERSELIEYLKKREIYAVFHYIPLHLSTFGQKYSSEPLPNAEFYSDHLLRLPLYAGLSSQNQYRVIEAINSFFGDRT